MRTATAWRLVGTLLVVFVLVGCAGTGPEQEDPRLGETFDPLALADDDIAPVAASVRREPVPSAEALPPSPASQPAAMPAVESAGPEGTPPSVEEGQDSGEVTHVPGYRVQLFASVSREKAEEVRAQVGAERGLVSYVEYDPPFYKVQLGDFRERAAAERLAQALRVEGMSDAFWVPATIRLSR